MCLKQLIFREHQHGNIEAVEENLLLATFYYCIPTLLDAGSGCHSSRDVLIAFPPVGAGVDTVLKEDLV
jgi:hypothetical protein